MNEDKPLVVVDNSDEDTPKQPQTAGFNQQAFGPWSSLDPKTKQLVVRTNVSSGSTRNNFKGTSPPAPTVNEPKTAITGGFEFAINVVTGGRIAGYHVYRSPVNNPAVAKLISFLSQPKIIYPYQSIKFQDITTANPFYFVGSVNTAGQESARVPVVGNPAPVPPVTAPLPSGGASGAGSGGGRGNGNPVGRRTL
jgi:hypothetical protein